MGTALPQGAANLRPSAAKEVEALVVFVWYAAPRLSAPIGAWSVQWAQPGTE